MIRDFKKPSIMCLFSVTGGLFLAWLLSLAGVDLDVRPGAPSAGFIASSIAMAPLIETALLSLLFLLLQGALSNTMAAVTSALLLAGLHSFISPWLGLLVAWPFLVFSYPYFSIPHIKMRHAAMQSFIAHAAHNLIVILIGLFM